MEIFIGITTFLVWTIAFWGYFYLERLTDNITDIAVGVESLEREVAELHVQIKYLDKSEVIPERKEGEEFLGI